jgi:hypothetical protein
MLLKNATQNRTLMMRLGLLFLIVGALSLRFLAKVPHVTENLADGLAGLFYGLSIGLLLLSLRSRRA